MPTAHEAVAVHPKAIGDLGGFRIAEAVRLKLGGVDNVPEKCQEKIRELLVLSIDGERLADMGLYLNRACKERPSGLIDVQIGDQVNATIALGPGYFEAVPQQQANQQVAAISSIC